MSFWTYEARGYCTRAGYAALDRVLALLCDLGNAALQERRDAWKMQRKSIGYRAQCRSLTLVRQDDPNGLGSIGVSVARGALRRIDKAFAAFFRRVRNGEKPGYPRFRSRKRYRTIEVRDIGAGSVRHVGRWTNVRLAGLPLIRIERRQELPPEKPRAIRIVRRTCGVTVYLVYPREPAALPNDSQVIGVDVGVRKRLTLSNGETVPAEQIDWKALRRAQRALSRSQRHSRRRRKRAAALRALRRKDHVRRRNACHRITTPLVRRFGTIVVENLQIENMTVSAAGTVEAPGRNVKAKTALNRLILEQSWGLILGQLVSKAAWAGRRVLKIPPQYTSQDCSACGTRREKPDAREHWTCSACGAVHDRDVNAALNIRRAGIQALGSSSGERVAA